MSAILLLVLVPFIGSLLTFFSGLGLATILLPAFAILFPVEIAVVMTAIVHLLNNIFKVLLVGRFASLPILLKFGLPAVVGSFIGAGVLVLFTKIPIILHYSLFGREHFITWAGLIIGIAMIIFSIMEFYKNKTTFVHKNLIFGGILSGFFGGLSGHQGALRSAFLVSLKLKNDVFIATSVVIACGVDLVRLVVYGIGIHADLSLDQHRVFLIIAVISGWAGALVGKKIMHLASSEIIRSVVASMLMLFGALMAVGII